MRTCEARTLDQEGFHMATSAGACPNAGSTYVFDYILCVECAEEARRALRWSRDDEETQRDVLSVRCEALIYAEERAKGARVDLGRSTTSADPRWKAARRREVRIGRIFEDVLCRLWQSAQGHLTRTAGFLLDRGILPPGEVRTRPPYNFSVRECALGLCPRNPSRPGFVVTARF